MKMAKKYLGFSMLLAVLLLLPVMLDGQSASAADRIASDDIVIDYANQAMQVTIQDPDTEVMVAFPTVKLDASGKIGDIIVKSWDIYDRSEMKTKCISDDETEIYFYTATIDLSPVNAVKGGYVLVRTDKSSVANLIHFNAVHSKLAASYDAMEGNVSIIDKAAGGSECDSIMEYRTQYGDWQPYDSGKSSLRHYEQQGVTLYFREKCGYEDWEKGFVSSGMLSDAATTTRQLEACGDLQYVQFEAASTFSGKELKVKIPKRRNGPTAVFNYTKRTITVKKNQEYRQDTLESFEETGEENIVLEIGGETGMEAGILEVRKSAVYGTKKYTPVSKITRYEYPATRSLVPSADPTGYLGQKANKLSITYNERTKRIECSSTDLQNTYLLYVVRDGGEEPVAGSKVSVTVKPALNAGQPRVVKLAKSKFPSGSDIYVAYAGNMRTKQWATVPVHLGTVE